jgi:hypothetical protein
MERKLHWIKPCLDHKVLNDCCCHTPWSLLELLGLPGDLCPWGTILVVNLSATHRYHTPDRWDIAVTRPIGVLSPVDVLSPTYDL